jgi:hypothetical protein
MTAQTYQADDDQLVLAHDQAISEDNLIEPEASLAAPESDLAEPDADLTVAESDLAEPDADLTVAESDLAEPDADLTVAESDLAEPDADLTVAEPDLAEPDADLTVAESDLAEPDADLTVAEPDLAEPDLAEPDAFETAHEDLTPQPADAVALADSEPATSMVSGYPGFIPDGDDRAAEPEMADSLPLVSVAFTVPESVPDSHPAAITASAAGPWNEVQAMFVDDPRASIERAAGLVDERVEELIQSFRQRRSSIQSAWQADDAGTEELRVALQHYRGFWNSLEDLPARD